MKEIKYNYEKINMVEINDIIFPHKETHYTLSRKRLKFKKIDKGLFSSKLKKYLDEKPKAVETNKPKSYLGRLKLWFSNLKNKF